MKGAIKKTGAIAFAVLFIMAPNMGCRKKKDTVAQITVRNSSNELVAGASVHVFPVASDPDSGGSPNTLAWDFTSTTNSAGVASFDFNDVYQLGQAGVVVANIEASKDGSVGEGVIKVEQETVSEETVFI